MCNIWQPTSDSGSSASFIQILNQRLAAGRLFHAYISDGWQQGSPESHAPGERPAARQWPARRRPADHSADAKRRAPHSSHATSMRAPRSAPEPEPRASEVRQPLHSAHRTQART